VHYLSSEAVSANTGSFFCLVAPAQPSLRESVPKVGPSHADVDRRAIATPRSTSRRSRVRIPLGPESTDL